MVYWTPAILNNMAEFVINGIPVSFPFQPYDVQKQYMEKVIECLQKGVNGVLESPTGTGKTLSLLCSSLAWLMVKKAQLQAQLREGMFELSDGDFVPGLQNSLNNAGGIVNKGESSMWGMPKIIYASRTHSQLSQVMQELKRTNYSHVKVAVLGSRDQMCIHPEVSRETSNAGKVHMCRLRVSSRTCYFYNNVESKKDDTTFRQGGILDIEDLVSAGRKLRCCPYYVSKELKSQADIIFMPYNYLLDPKTRRSQGVEVANNVILLDEAHNIEKICEESASLQIRSTDVALCIDEVTQVMKDISELPNSYPEESSTANRDFIAEDLCILKTMFLELEKAVDEIPASDEGITYPGSYILDLLAKAEITHGKRAIVLDLVEKLVLYLSTTGTSPYARRGVGLQKFSDLLKIVFSSDTQTLDHINNIKTAYKVHVKFEEVKSTRSDSWGPRVTPQPSINKRGRVISYWCFSPGYSMKQLQEQGIRCLILTSGTLSPLPALISELGIKVDVQLENPHIVKSNQVCVGIVPRGPDGYELNSSYNTRNTTEYLSSLGRCILNLSHIIPHGLLVFFPSYPIMMKCRDHWQEEGLWTRLSNCKTVYVEPQGKDSFLATMAEYYNKIVDPSSPGACFMAVTRGKVSEGLDFSDNNGRAVIVTGLPYPPFKDPRIQLKRQYLDEVQKNKSQNLSGNFWYQLEASRAVNQAIGRVIRHANDYGAILLCDKRFDNPSFKKQLSAWLQPHIKLYKDFGAAVKDVKQFFKAAEQCLPAPKSRSFSIVKDTKVVDKVPAPVPASFDVTARVTARSSVCSRTNTSSQSSLVISDWSPNDYTQNEALSGTSKEHKQSLDFFGALNKPTNTIDFNDTSFSSSCKRQHEDSEDLIDSRKRKLKLVPVNFNASTSCNSVLTEEIIDYNKQQDRTDNKKSVKKGQEDCENSVPKKSAKSAEITEYIKQVKSMLSTPKYKEFIAVVGSYSRDGDIDVLLQVLQEVFITDGLYTLLRGFQRFIKTEHLDRFKDFLQKA